MRVLTKLAVTLPGAAERLLYQDCSAPGEPFELVFHHVTRPWVRPHCHDFAELALMQGGSCRHVVNGVAMVLRPGDLIYIRADDVHEFRLIRGRPVQIVNLAFPAGRLAELVGRYGLGGDDFWGEAPLPERLRHVPVGLMPQVEQYFRTLQVGAHTMLALDLLFLSLLQQLHVLAEDPLAACPPWLAEACGKMQQPKHFIKGVAEFARLSGRSLAHVSRVLRQVSGRTPVEWVTDWRLRHAASRLTMGERDIAGIAYECGFRSLGRFYHVFTTRYGMPPARFRQQQRYVFPGG